MSQQVGKMNPLTRFEAYTPHNDTIIEVTRAVYLEESGPMAVLGQGDTAPVTIPALAAGVWHPMAVVKILDTGTTATTVYIGR